jgi:hypothetical protein
MEPFDQQPVQARKLLFGWLDRGCALAPGAQACKLVLHGLLNQAHRLCRERLSTLELDQEQFQAPPQLCRLPGKPLQLLLQRVEVLLVEPLPPGVFLGVQQ